MLYIVLADDTIICYNITYYTMIMCIYIYIYISTNNSYYYQHDKIAGPSEDRMKYIEKLLGDSADRHARELKELKDRATIVANIVLRSLFLLLLLLAEGAEGRLNKRVCVYIHIYIYMYIHVHIYIIYIYIRFSFSLSLYIYIYIYIYICMHTHKHMPHAYAHTCMHM